MWCGDGGIPNCGETGKHSQSAIEHRREQTEQQCKKNTKTKNTNEELPHENECKNTVPLLTLPLQGPTIISRWGRWAQPLGYRSFWLNSWRRSTCQHATNLIKNKVRSISCRSQPQSTYWKKRLADVRGVKPSMKKCRPGKGIRFTASFRRSQFN